ncbi:MAG: CDC48 family AAA ATPase [Dehalococcoidales bacterium]|nr:CDC48 family AAA ATPase [Dehalococcoidales bacterium]
MPDGPSPNSSDQIDALTADQTVESLPEASLRVTEALLEDVDSGVVRIDPADLSRIGVLPGDVVVVTGKRSTVARAEPAPPFSCGRRLIHLDGTLRENAQASLDDKVTVRRSAARVAQTVLLAPAEPVSYGPQDLSRLRALLDGLAVIAGDQVKSVLYGRRGHFFKVAATEPEGAVVVGPYTDLRLKAPEVSRERPFKVKYEDIGGLEGELQRIREMIELPMKYPDLFARLRIEPPKGVLLHGPPGTGKTLIARAVASEVDAHFIHLSGPEIIHKFYGESEAKLREVFDEAQRRAPSIIFLDELDAIAPKRADVVGDVEKRVVAQLLACMDGLVARGQVVVIGATNLPELLDPALRRPGRFDREITINVPSRPGRLRILQIHARGMPLAEDVSLERLAEITHGYVGADIEVLCKEAGMLALRDLLARADFDAQDAATLSAQAFVSMKHFLGALKSIEPTATREFFVEKPNVRWEDVGGLDQIRDFLLACVEWPTRHGDLFAQAGIRRVRGLLLSGPSGTGKTLLAKALATETGLNFITVDGAMLLSKWVGESEKTLRQVFKKAKQASPCLLFFDGLDSLAPVRRNSDTGASERLVGQFLSELDNLSVLDEVVLLGATNRIDLVDPALLRPGRFDFVIDTPLPDVEARREIFRVHTRRMPLAPDVRLQELADHSEGLSGADIEAVCQRAAIQRMREFIAARAESPTADKSRFLIGRQSLLASLEQVVHVRGRVET